MSLKSTTAIRSPLLGEDGSPSNQRRSDAGMLVDGTHLGIKQEGMVAAVPRNVDEPDQQAVLVPGANPAQAVRADPAPTNRATGARRATLSARTASSCTSLRH